MQGEVICRNIINIRSDNPKLLKHLALFHHAIPALRKHVSLF